MRCRFRLYHVVIILAIGYVVLEVAASQHFLSGLTHLRWLPYVIPTQAAWDGIHAGHIEDGGIWKYEDDVHSEIIHYIQTEHRNYSSLLDVSCNIGFMLQRLEATNPHAKHYGTDISSVLVNATQARCASCVTAQYDLNGLRDPNFKKLTPDFPDSFDLVLVSDVLVYMNWGGLVPGLHQLGFFPKRTFIKEQERFFQHLTAMARTEVIFSNHQQNPVIMTFFEAMQVKRVRVNYIKKGERRTRSIFIAPGRARS